MDTKQALLGCVWLNEAHITKYTGQESHKGNHSTGLSEKNCYIYLMQLLWLGNIPSLSKSIFLTTLFWYFLNGPIKNNSFQIFQLKIFIWVKLCFIPYCISIIFHLMYIFCCNLINTYINDHLTYYGNKLYKYMYQTKNTTSTTSNLSHLF